MKRERLIFLDSVKFISCIGIFVGHYLGVFYNFCEIKPDLSQDVLIILNKWLRILIDAPFLLNVFYIISGYLASLKEINSFKELVISIKNRYIRFCIPLFVINMIVYVMNVFRCFSTVEIGLLLTNPWIASYYAGTIDFSIVIKESLLLGCGLNGPLWTLRPIFLGTCLIYVYKYMTSKMSMEYCDILAVLGLNFLFKINIVDNFNVCLICFVGVVLWRLWKLEHNRNSFISVIMLIFVLLLEMGAHSYIYEFMRMKLSISFVWAFNQNWVLLYAFLFVYFMKDANGVRKFFETNVWKKIGKLSFAVYVLHWPLVCSVSLVLYSILIKYFTYTQTFIINIVVSTLVLIVISNIYDVLVSYIMNLKKGFHLKLTI